MADYSQSGAGDYLYDEPQKTSVLAILSLIFGLICFIPVLGVIGIVLGVLALITIGSSGGKTKGTGLAVAGIVIGLLASVVWTGALFAVNSGIQQYLKFGTVVSEIESSSYDQARLHFAKDVREGITDEEFEAFRMRMEEELGAYQASPQGLPELISSFSEVGSGMENLGSPGMPYANQLIPLPLTFEKGEGLVMLAFQNPATESGPTGAPAFINLGVLGPQSDDIIWLDDLPAMPGSGTGSESESESDASPDAEASAGADAEPADTEPADADGDTPEGDSEGEG